MFHLRKDIKIEPAAPAMIMAIGIFLLGGMQYFPKVDNMVGHVFAIVLLGIWSAVVVLFLLQGKTYFLDLIKAPIRFFAVGTWIASTSVLCQVVLKYFPQLHILLRGLHIFNSILLSVFLVIVIYKLMYIWKNRAKYYADGIILLITVSIQSVVIVQIKLFSVPSFIATIGIVLGIIMYMIGIFFIFYRYTHTTWNLADHWSNTNCIIHGALSISGLAMVTVGAFSGAIITVFWCITFSLLCIIEIVELMRARQRIKKYGWKHGVFTYHITQWSRNFTFGMFFVFTLSMMQSEAYALTSLLSTWKTGFLSFWIWVVLLFLMIELILFLLYYSLHRVAVRKA